MEKYLFIGGELDGKFVETDERAEYVHQTQNFAETEEWLENKPPKEIDIKTQVYKKSFFANNYNGNVKRVVFYAIEGTIFDNELANRVFELASKT